MSYAFHSVTRPTLLSVLVASACSAMAAQRVDLAAANAKAVSSVAPTVHSLTGLSADELKPLGHVIVNGKNVTRFQQYYLGIPILGETIVVEGQGNAATSKPSRLSGTVLRDLSQDLPSVRPALNSQEALEQAKFLSGARATSKDQVNLYIRQTYNSAAHLVYVVSFVNHNAPIVSQPTYLIDADSGAVIDQWEGFDTRDGSGPGGTYQSALTALAKTPGWNEQMARELLRVAHDIYGTADSEASQGSCGAEQAAQVLGYNVVAARAAFRNVGKCRSSITAQLSGTTLADLSAPADDTQYVAGEIHRIEESWSTSAPKAAFNTKESTKTIYSNWELVTEADVKGLGRHSIADYARNRFASVAGSGLQWPDTVSFNRFKVGSDGYNTSEIYNLWTDRRFVGNGQISDIPNYTNWQRVKGYNAQVIANFSDSPQTTTEVLMFQSATTTATNWKVSATSGMKVTTKFSIPLIVEGQVEVSFSATVEGGGSSQTTQTTNFYRPIITIPVGHEAVFELVERWRPVTAVWTVPIEFRGWVGADYHRQRWNGYHNWAVDAPSYFHEYGNRPGAESYSVNLDEKYQIEMMVRAYTRPRGA
ncbi:MAG: PepSY domain-containing protein [Rhodanobacteraceae bacterium]|nr:PepSY domain-containing protein [Rhodanobacteraceae bacterium]